MLLVLEIALIAFAWKRGWRWWSLVPLVVIVGTAFIAGMDTSFTGIDAPLLLKREDVPLLVKIVVNATFIVTMIAMIFRPFRKGTASKIP